MSSYHHPEVSRAEPLPASRSADARSALEAQVRAQVLGLVLSHWPQTLYRSQGIEGAEPEAVPNPVCFPCALEHAHHLALWVLSGLNPVVDDHHRRE